MRRVLIFLLLLLCAFSESTVEAKDYMLVCGKEDDVAKVWYLDLEESLSTGESVVVGETELKDESGNVITATPLGITSDGGKFFWVSFDERRIRKYNIFGVPEKVDVANWYWTVANRPDGLYLLGNFLFYSSSSDNKIYSINVYNGLGVETNYGVVNRKLSLNGIPTDSPSINHTTQEYINYNPTAISGRYLCSASLGKISKTFSWPNLNLIETLPLTERRRYIRPEDTPIWINEQDTPAPVVGITEVTDYSVPERHVIYLSCTNGNVYKVRFKNKVVSLASIETKNAIQGVREDTGETTYAAAEDGPFPVNRRYYVWSYYTTSAYRHWGRVYRKVVGPSSFIEARIIQRPNFEGKKGRDSLPGAAYGYAWREDDSTLPIKNTGGYICTITGNWDILSHQQLFEDTILGSGLYTRHYLPPTGIANYVKVFDVSTTLPIGTHYQVEIYEGEGDSYILPLLSEWYQADFFGYRLTRNAAHINVISYLTDNGSLTILDQFTTTSSSIDSQDITITKNLSIAKDIHSDPIPFYPSLEADPVSKTKIHYKTIVKPDKVGFEIRNLVTSSLIYSLNILGTAPVTTDKFWDEYEWEWDGKDTAGQTISKGLYSIKVSLKDSQNNLLYDSVTTPPFYAYAYPPSINTTAKTATFNYRVWAWGSPTPEKANVYMNLYDDDEFRLIKRLLVAEEIPTNLQQTVTWNYSAYSLGKYYYTIWAEDEDGNQSHVRGGSFTVPEHIITGTREVLVKDRVGWKYEGPIVRVRSIGMVAVGDSVTAGMQHFTLVDYLQRMGYANLIAQQMQLDKFDLPLIKPPGAGIPLFQTDAQGRIIPDVHLTPGTGVHLLRLWANFPPAGSRIQPDIFVHNVAVPGANTNQVLNTQADTEENRLFELVLQGRFDKTGRGTEVTQAVFMRPNLIILWTGNNDVLGAAIWANLNEMTDPPNTEPVIFEEAFREIVRRLKEGTAPDGPTGPLKGADIIVSDIPDVSSIPNLFRVGEEVGDLPFEVFRRRGIVIGSTENVTNQVENFVIPRGVNGRRGEQYPEGTLVPMIWLFRYFSMDISPFNAGPDADVFVEDRVLTPGVDLNSDGDFIDPGEFLNEIEQIRERTNQINNIIRNVAREYNLPVVSANDLLRSVDASFAGGTFSFDGVHPSNRGHRLVANEFIKKLNEVILERGSFGKRNTLIDELTIVP